MKNSRLNCEFPDEFVSPGICFGGGGGGGGGGGDGGTDGGTGDGSDGGAGPGDADAGDGTGDNDGSNAAANAASPSNSPAATAADADAAANAAANADASAAASAPSLATITVVAEPDDAPTAVSTPAGAPNSNFSLSTVQKGLGVAANVATVAFNPNPISKALALANLAKSMSDVGPFGGASNAGSGGSASGENTYANFSISGGSAGNNNGTPLKFNRTIITEGDKVTIVDEQKTAGDIDMLASDPQGISKPNWLALVGALGAAQLGLK